MSVLPSDIVVYGSVNMPEADGAINGGPVDFSRRVAFYDIAPAGNLDVMSSSASDTATKITFYGRDATGVIQNQTLSLNGQTWVTGSQSLERLLYAALSGATANGPAANPGGTAAVGDVALAAHSCVLPTGSVTTDATARNAQSGSANHTGTTPALFKLQAGDAASVSPGQVIWIRSGTGANQLRQIIAASGYGTDVVAVSRDWATIPDNTTTYKILQGKIFEISPNPVTAITRLFSNTAADGPAGTQRTAATAATAPTTFDIQKNGANVGTMVFAPSAAAATFTMNSAILFNAGDVLTLVAPSAPDATVANLAWTIMGIRQ